MKRTILGLIILALGFTACENIKKPQLENQNVKDMKSYVSIFEIPATDISRAIEFYQTILDIKIEKMDMSEMGVPDMVMGLLPYEDQMVTAVIMKGEGYQPSANGVTIYLNGGDNLQTILDKVVKSGGKIIVPKTPHADESGFFALFIDSEGNKMGLHSPN
ncbi:VOC family protein [Chondrinema litorale]|uniref:VOC family protein n=1 Tax=Chondrinema litorale TaxID=2994555 RepID=UPI00254328EE|nr:VOC family protein [Chondrinema litorale]UZR98159.1 VOC family protein [Chondrinema litorale]